MTAQELYKKGEFLFGNDFRKIANWIGFELTENVSSMDNTLEIIDELHDNYCRFQFNIQ